MLSSFRGNLYSKPIALALFAGLVALTSCIPQKKMLLMQYDKLIDSTYAKSFNGTDFEDSIYRILPNDYLYINITTVEKPISQFIEPSAGLNYLNDGNQALVGYHVADDGRIFFPYVGFIPLAG
jgi:protein involved in polysaccharide export with SLBB domain